MIAIDGPAGSGKSFVARQVAEQVGFLYISTGIMYRIITLQGVNKQIPFEDEECVYQVARKCIRCVKQNRKLVLVNNLNITRKLRSPIIDKYVSQVATFPRIRALVTFYYQELGQKSSLVCEGRDVATCIFPDAEVKIYLYATLEERAHRLHQFLKQKGYHVELGQVLQETAQRDQMDMTRKDGSLQVAPGAVTLNTTRLTCEQTVEKIINIISLYKQSLRHQ